MGLAQRLVSMVSGLARLMGRSEVAVPLFRTLAVEGRLVLPLVGDARLDDALIGRHVTRGTILTQKGSHSRSGTAAPDHGTVIGVTKVRLTDGRETWGIEFDASGQIEEPPPSRPMREIAAQIAAMDAVQVTGWLERTVEAGIGGKRAACFALAEQLLQAVKRPVDAVMVNLLDSDQKARLNATLGAWRAAELMAGAMLAARMGGAQAPLVVIDRGLSGKWVEPLRAAAIEAGVDLVLVENGYPQGDPTLLLHSVMQRKLRPGRSPVEAGAIIMDGPAAVGVGELFLTGSPPSRLPVVICDQMKREGHYFWVTPGTQLKSVLLAAGVGGAGRDIELRCGDLLRDIRTPREAVIGGSELVVHVIAPEEPATVPNACVRCGWCMDGCPVRIHPAGLLDAAQKEDLELAEHHGLSSCIECGVCSFVCPSQLPLLGGIRQLRRMDQGKGI